MDWVPATKVAARLRLGWCAVVHIDMRWSHDALFFASDLGLDKALGELGAELWSGWRPPTAWATWLQARQASYRWIAAHRGAALAFQFL